MCKFATLVIKCKFLLVWGCMCLREVFLLCWAHSEFIQVQKNVYSSVITIQLRACLEKAKSLLSFNLLTDADVKCL
jgi:hypothetical protein